MGYALRTSGGVREAQGCRLCAPFGAVPSQGDAGLQAETGRARRLAPKVFLMTDPRNAPESGDADGFDSDPFFELGLAPTIVDDAAAAGLIKPTPIEQAIPAMLKGVI